MSRFLSGYLRQIGWSFAAAALLGGVLLILIGLDILLSHLLDHGGLEGVMPVLFANGAAMVRKI